jgi:hypothetical protein
MHAELRREFAYVGNGTLWLNMHIWLIRKRNMNGGEPMLLLIFHDRRASFRMFLAVAVLVMNAGFLKSACESDRLDVFHGLMWARLRVLLLVDGAFLARYTDVGSVLFMRSRLLQFPRHLQSVPNTVAQRLYPGVSLSICDVSVGQLWVRGTRCRNSSLDVSSACCQPWFNDSRPRRYWPKSHGVARGSVKFDMSPLEVLCSSRLDQTRGA